jgi:hypothetical protein
VPERLRRGLRPASSPAGVDAADEYPLEDYVSEQEQVVGHGVA